MGEGLTLHFSRMEERPPVSDFQFDPLSSVVALGVILFSG